MQIDDIQRALLKMAQLAGLSRNPGIRSAIESLPLIIDEQIRGERIQSLLELLSPRAALAVANGAEDHPFLPQPEPEELGELREGDLIPGFLPPLSNEDPLPIPLHQVDMLKHVLVAAPTGEGKTTWVINTVVQLIKNGVPVQVFDTVGEYGDLLASAVPETVVIPFFEFRRNPFDGPWNLAREEWLYHMTDYLDEALFYRDGTINLFRHTCQQVLESDQELNAGTFAEEVRKTPQKSRRISDYFESLKRLAYVLDLPTYRCAAGFDLTQVFQTPVVFDLASFPDDIRQFFVADLVTWLQAWRCYERDRKLEQVLVFDELSKFANKESAIRSTWGEPYLLQVLRQARKRDIGAILADQTYSLFHDVIRSNCRTKVILETRDGPSRLEIARDLDLILDQREFLREISFSSGNRRALVRLPDYPHPFLMLVPYFEKPPQTDRKEAPDFEWTPLPETEEKPRRESDGITHELLTYHGVIACNPFDSETERDSKMKNWSAAKGTRMRKKLAKMELIEEYWQSSTPPANASTLSSPPTGVTQFSTATKSPMKLPRVTEAPPTSTGS